MSEAPTVYAKIVDWEKMTKSGQMHYGFVQRGANLISHVAGDDIAVHSSCCEVQLGVVAKDKAATLREWMDKGYTFMTTVYEPAFAQVMGDEVRVHNALEAKFTPLPSMKATTSVKDAAPTDKQLEKV